MKRTCETLRMVGTVVHNSTPGRKRGDMIRDAKKLFKLPWEQVKLQTVEEMKAALLGMAHMKGVKVTQKGKPVDPFKDEPKMKRTK